VHTPQLLGCGEFFGASRHESGCETASACTLVALDADVLRAVAGRSLALARRMLQAVATRLCEVEFDVAGHHASRTSAQRILDYLSSSPAAARARRRDHGRAGATKEGARRAHRHHPRGLLAQPARARRQGVIVVDKRLIHIQNAALLDTNAGRAAAAPELRAPQQAARRDEASCRSGELINLCGRLRLLSSAWRSTGLIAQPRRRRRSRCSAQLRQLIAEFERSARGAAGCQPRAGAGRGAGGRRPGVGAVSRALSAPSESRGGAGAAASEDFITAADFLNASPAASAPRAASTWSMSPAATACCRSAWRSSSSSRASRACPDPQAQIAASCRAFEHNLQLLRENAGELPELVAQLEATAGLWSRFVASLDPAIRQPHRIGRVRSVLDEGERLLRYTNTLVKLFERLAR
jgi:hypothetical protein